MKTTNMKRSGFKAPTPEKLKEIQGRKIAKAKEKVSKASKLPKPVKNSLKVAKRASKGKVKTQAQLKKELDRVFSKYVRQKDADESGMVSCITCGKTLHWKEIQAGHFVSRQYLTTRWDENNVRPQCVGDNIFGNGKPLDFEEALKKELGQDYVEEMKKKRHLVLKLDRLWYNERIQFYKDAIKSFNFEG